MPTKNKTSKKLPVPPKRKSPGKLPKPPKTKTKKPSADQNKIANHTRPKPGGNCARCWEILDGLFEKNGVFGLHGDLMKQLDKEHIPLATGRGQIWRWKAFNGIKGRAPKPAEKLPKIKQTKKPSKIVMPKLKLVKATPKRKSAQLKSPGKLPKPPVKKLDIESTPVVAAVPAVAVTNPTVAPAPASE